MKSLIRNALKERRNKIDRLLSEILTRKIKRMTIGDIEVYLEYLGQLREERDLIDEELKRDLTKEEKKILKNYPSYIAKF